MIVDMTDPTRPDEVGRWWWPGMWQGGGEEPDWPATEERQVHHGMVEGNRAYVGAEAKPPLAEVSFGDGADGGYDGFRLVGDVDDANHVGGPLAPIMNLLIGNHQQLTTGQGKGGVSVPTLDPREPGQRARG